MKTVALGEVVDLRAGVGFPPRLQGRASGDYPMVKVGDISRTGRSPSNVLETADHYVSQSDLGTLRMEPIPAGSVLFAKIGEAIRHNHRVIAGRRLLLDNNAMAAIPRSSDIDTGYLFRQLQAIDFYSLSSTTTVPSLRKTELARIAIPLPPLEEQRRIAAILDQADVLRAKRRQVLAHLDSLTQSIFHNMFSAVMTTSLIAPLGELTTVMSGLTKGRRISEPTTQIPYLAVSNVQAGHLQLDVVKVIPATEAEVQKYRLVAGDLLLTEGGDPDKLGRGTIWRNELDLCLHQNHVFRVRIDDNRRVLPEYLASWMAEPPARGYFLRSAKQTTGIATINSTQLKALPVPVPPLSMQQRYVDRVDQVRDTRVIVERTMAADDELFASLQSRAFRGEL